ncbi:MAG TPA: hypothetical protein PKH07_17295, partial [bacterium]|nr:hypothetical protein [bacterium]
TPEKQDQSWDEHVPIARIMESPTFVKNASDAVEQSDCHICGNRYRIPESMRMPLAQWLQGSVLFGFAGLGAAEQVTSHISSSCHRNWS